jgi:hypothetical protein
LQTLGANSLSSGIYKKIRVVGGAELLRRAELISINQLTVLLLKRDIRRNRTSVSSWCSHKKGGSALAQVRTQWNASAPTDFVKSRPTHNGQT